MAEVLKVLGQSSATAAQASDVLNLIKDPSFEGVTQTMQSIPGGVSGASQWGQISGTQWWFMSDNGSYWSAHRIGDPATWTNADNTAGGQNYKYGLKSLGIASTNASQNWQGNMGLAYGLSTSSSYGFGSTSSARWAGPDRSIPVTGSTTYYYGCDMLMNNLTNWYFRISWYNSSGGYISGTQQNPSGGSSSWTRNSWSVTSPASAAWAGIEIYGSVYGSNNIEGKLDGIFFGTAASLSSTFPEPTSTSGNLLTAPFTDRYNSTYSGTIHNSTTVKNYAGAAVDIYTVPSAKASVVSSIVVANPSTSATSYRIAVVPSGETLDLKHWNFFDIPLSANSSQAITLGLTLRAGDKIKVSSDTSNTQFSVYGSELDQA
jgi:hypothetical protein